MRRIGRTVFAACAVIAACGPRDNGVEERLDSRFEPERGPQRVEAQGPRGRGATRELGRDVERTTPPPRARIVVIADGGAAELEQPSQQPGAAEADAGAWWGPGPAPGAPVITDAGAAEPAPRGRGDGALPGAATADAGPGRGAPGSTDESLSDGGVDGGAPR